MSALINKNFSYASYESMLKNFLDKGYVFRSFAQPQDSTHQVLMRHDIDFDVELAYEIAKLEHNYNVQSTFFYMLRSHHYNFLEKKVLDTVTATLKLGHNLGLHFDCANYKNSSFEEKRQVIKKEVQTIEEWLNFEVSAVSFHRPEKELLRESGELTKPLKHTYMPEFLDEMTYLSDSKGEWRYGHPLESKAFEENQNIHILVHPIWWKKKDLERSQVIEHFIETKSDNLKNSIEANCTVYRR